MIRFVIRLAQKPTMMAWPIITALLTVATLSGCAKWEALSAHLPPVPEISPEDTAGERYSLGPGDQVNITVFGEQELSGVYSIDPEGMLAMPLIKPIKASGQTLASLEQQIHGAYKGDYLVEPRVSVSMQRFRPFFILGEVRAPGGYDYVHNMTVEQAVAIGGGLTYRGHRDDIVIRRTLPVIIEAEAESMLSPEAQAKQSEDLGDIVLKQSFKGAMQSRVYPGDTIEIGERFF